VLRDAVRVCAAASLLAGSVVLAFFSGGYFPEPRLWAGVASCAVLAVAALVAVRPLPRATPGRLALAGLAALTALTAASTAWAPLEGPAHADTQRLLLYLAALAAAIALFRDRVGQAVEPAVAGGLLVVVAYGLAGRLLPELVPQTPSISAEGRLDQPLTYWNAVGAVAAIGLALAAGLASDPARPRALRVAAAAAAGPFGMALYVTYSRGALVAAAAGLLVLLVLGADRRRVRGVLIAAGAAAAAAGVAALLPGVASLEGDRARDGAIGLALLALVCAAAAWLARRDRGAAAPVPFRLPYARLLGAGAAVALVALAVVAVAASERRPGSAETGARAGRLVSLESHRYEYWKVAAGAFADEPLRGIGSGNFRVRWLRERPVPESARDAHSLYLETAAELGLLGLAALGLLLAGSVAGVRRGGAGVAVAAAALAAFAVQAGIDWLWEMPAVSLPALFLLGLVLARADDRRAPRHPRPPAPRTEPRRPRGSA